MEQLSISVSLMVQQTFSSDSSWADHQMLISHRTLKNYIFTLNRVNKIDRNVPLVVNEIVPELHSTSLVLRLEQQQLITSRLKLCKLLCYHSKEKYFR